ncbi:MAG: TonB-dependent receptor [Niabella sp.]
MNKTIAKYIYIWLLLTGIFLKADAQYGNVLHGVVEDVQGKPLQFATVKLSVDEVEMASRSTNVKGEFEFPAAFIKYDSIVLQASFVNKATQTVVLKAEDYQQPLKIVLQNLSLTLNDVVVTGVVKNQNSASSIVFDEEAIRQLQAFSLADVLNTLPGRKTEAPDLQSPQTISLRTSADGVDAMNNSFGVAIFIDGVRISNETNMQSRGLSSHGLSSSLLKAYSETTSSDVTYNGFDLRDIPMSNIASIEVIQGVGTARYGDFTGGAILITTKAGKTPYSFNTNINGGSSSFSLSKGFDLGKKNGALNFSLGYTNSNEDPRDKVKSYNNINTSLRWSKEVTKYVTNSFTIGGDMNLDEKKADPDDDAQKMSYSKRRTIRFTNSTHFTFNKRILDNVSLLLNYSAGYQDSYTQRLLNGLPKGIASRDTTGVYEGYYIPGNYLAVEHINGKPISYSINVDGQSKPLKTGNMTHQLGMGFAFDGSGNKGRGNIVDPDAPRWTYQSNQNERPYSYADSVNFTYNAAFYIQDNIRGNLFNKSFNLSAGLRVSLQNERINPQPRLAFNYKLNNHWSLSSSYGITFKTPSLAHLYPAPTYFDIPILSLYTGYTKTSLYLVYTKKVLAENRNLKNAVTQQFEQGVTYSSKHIGSGSVFAYYKMNRNGFNTYSEYIPTDVPVYDYTLNADSTISYFPTGETNKVWDLKRTRMNNGLHSNDYGFQFSFQSNMIKLISTSAGVRAGYSVSKYYGSNLTSTEVASTSAQEKGVVYVEYKNQQTVSRNAVLNFTTNTHIPQIGFIVSVVADYEPLLKERSEAQNIYPVAYTLSTGEYVTLTSEAAKSDALSYLRKSSEDGQLSIPSGGYWTFNLRVAKEIKKKIRLSVSAYNVLNITPKAYTITDADGEVSVGIYNYNPVSITVGASLQL